MEYKYYVYEWFNTDTNEVFYVGKGSKKRSKNTKNRNELFIKYFNENNCDVRIVKGFDDEEEAYKLEFERINELKEIGQCSCNLIAGGIGAINGQWNEDMRNKMSEYNPMKSEAQRERMRINNPMSSDIQRERMRNNNPMKNPDVIKKHKKNSRKVVIDGVVYNSVKEVMSEFNCSYPTVKAWCEKGVTKDLKECYFYGETPVKFTGDKYYIPYSRKVKYKGIVYDSCAEMANALSLGPSTVSRWAKSGFDRQGNECRYLDDNTKHVFVKNKELISNSKPIIVNEIWYPSRAEAERQLNLKSGYLAPYLRGERKNTSYICNYADQQPS